MHEEVLKGGWNQLRGEMKKTWAKLTDDDLALVDGEATRLYGVLQQKYGGSIDEIRDKVGEVVHSYDDLSLKGDWNIVKGKLQEVWGDLTDDELETAKGRKSQLVGLLQRKAGKTAAEAFRELDEVLKRA